MNYIELFAGIGGFRRGLEPLGHTCVGWVERDKFARQSYMAIWPEARDEWNAKDITTIRPSDVPRSDIWCFGFPCQDLSIAGRRLGFSGNRSSLFFTVMGLLRGISERDRPEWLVAENTMGFFSSNNGWDFLAAQVAMAEIGYDTEYDVFNPINFGIPQDRDRVFIVGHSRRFCGRKVFPLRIDGIKNTAKLKELTQGVADAHRVYDAQGVARTLKSDGGGLGAKTGLYQVPTDVSKTVRASGQGSYDGKHTWNLVQVGVVRRGTGDDAIYSERDVALTLDANYYKGLDAHQARTGVAVRAVMAPERGEKNQNGRRIKDDGEPMFTLTAQDRHGVMIARGPSGIKEFDNVSPTLRAEGVRSNNYLYHETRIRRLTPRECWRLFGRKDWEFERAKEAGVSDSQLYKQAGNSLVPKIVTAIASRFE